MGIDSGSRYGEGRADQVRQRVSPDRPTAIRVGQVSKGRAG